MRPFSLHIHTAERDFYNGDCLSIIIPTTTGQYGIQAHHRNMIAAIVPGTLEMILPEGNKEYAVVSGGMVKVRNNEVLILVNSALTFEETEQLEERIKADKEKEKELMKRSTKEFAEAETAMRRAIYKLKGRRNNNNYQ